MAGKWFGRAGTQARAALGVERASVGATELALDYDPATWFIGPLSGQDRTSWVTSRLEAVRADLGLAVDGEDDRAARRALEAFARSGAGGARVGFLRLGRGRQRSQTVTIHVGTPTGLNGWLGTDPDSWIRYADVRESTGTEPQAPVDVADGPQWRVRVRVVDLESGRTGLVRGLRQGDPLVAASALVTEQDVDRVLSDVTDLMLGISVVGSAG